MEGFLETTTLAERTVGLRSMSEHMVVLTLGSVTTITDRFP